MMPTCAIGRNMVYHAGMDSWHVAHPDLTLRAGEVHVWRAALDPPAAGLARLNELLAEDEQQRAQRFFFDRDRNRFVAARGTLRRLLGRYLDLAPAALRFGYGPQGKPFLAYPAQTRLRFNLSHAGDVALFALAWDRELGVDVEEERPDQDLQLLAAQFFAPGERKRLRELPPAERLAAFYAGWTRKEAFIKARGDGMALGLDQFEVSLAAGDERPWLRTLFDSAEAGRWALYTLHPGPGFSAALAVEGAAAQLACWQGL